MPRHEAAPLRASAPKLLIRLCLSMFIALLCICPRRGMTTSQRVPALAYGSRTAQRPHGCDRKAALLTFRDDNVAAEPPDRECRARIAERRAHRVIVRGTAGPRAALVAATAAIGAIARRGRELGPNRSAETARIQLESRRPVERQPRRSGLRVQIVAAVLRQRACVFDVARHRTGTEAIAGHVAERQITAGGDTVQRLFPAERPRQRTRSSPRTRQPDTVTPSATSSDRLSISLPPYPPIRPPAAITRWHGTSGRLQRRMMLPTARHARGRPASNATSP